MKPLLLTIFFLIPFISYSQYDFLKLEDSQIIFECIYDVEGKSAIEIEQMLTSMVPRIKDLKSFHKSDGIITASIQDARINYQPYGCTSMNVSAYINHPFESNVTIQWKEGKYRVVLSNMVFHTRGLGDFSGTLCFANRDKTGYDTKKITLRTGGCFEKYFADLFAIKKDHSDW